MKKYKVRYIKSEFVNINNVKLTSVWEEACLNTDFSFPWEDKEIPQTQFRALYDDANLYFRFDVDDDNICTYVDKNDKMEVINSDRVEIFFRADEQLSPYYCLEMDARSRLLDYKADYYRKFDFKWNWPGRNSIKIQSFIEYDKYIVQGFISLESLKKLNLLKDNEIQAGLYRAYCMSLPEELNSSANLRWISWMKPDSVKPDFHIPSSFGLLQLENIEE